MLPKVTFAHRLQWKFIPTMLTERGFRTPLLHQWGFRTTPRQYGDSGPHHANIGDSGPLCLTTGDSGPHHVNTRGSGPLHHISFGALPFVSLCYRSTSSPSPFLLPKPLSFFTGWGLMRVFTLIFI